MHLPTSPPPDKSLPGAHRLIPAAVMFGFFVGDLVTPLGVAAGMPYVIVVLLAARPGLRRLIVEAAVATSALTLLGAWLSPPAGVEWMAATNRGMSIAIIWATAVLSIQHAVATRKLAAAQNDAQEDPLTGLRNRRGFDQLIDAALARGSAALIMLDLDRFKIINDELGHPTGDRALVAAADVLRGVLRSGDQWNCARLGGDEFAFLIPVRKPKDPIASPPRS